MIEYLNLQEDDLDLVIGKALVKDSLGSKPQSDPQIRRTARSWFEVSLPQLQQAVCEEGKLGNYLVGPEAKERNILIGSGLVAPSR